LEVGSRNAEVEMQLKEHRRAAWTYELRVAFRLTLR